MKPPDYVLSNRRAWTGYAAEFAESGERHWVEEPCWGVWSIPETEVGLLPENLEGRDTLEMGCGTGYVSSWLARRGARPVGLDNCWAQLATARRLQRKHGLKFPLIHAIAEMTPLADASFDLVISEYGAAIWSDPHLWIPEASRLLRPGGELILLLNSNLLYLCAFDEDGVPADATLKRDYFGMHRTDWPDDGSVEFHLGHGDWIRLFGRHGFEVVELKELRPPEGSTTRFPYVSLEWARRWPGEEVWIARKRGGPPR